MATKLPRHSYYVSFLGTSRDMTNTSQSAGNIRYMYTRWKWLPSYWRHQGLRNLDMSTSYADPLEPQVEQRSRYLRSVHVARRKASRSRSAATSISSCEYRTAWTSGSGDRATWGSTFHSGLARFCWSFSEPHATPRPWHEDVAEPRARQQLQTRTETLACFCQNKKVCEFIKGVSLHYFLVCPFVQKIFVYLGALLVN